MSYGEGASWAFGATSGFRLRNKYSCDPQASSQDSTPAVARLVNDHGPAITRQIQRSGFQQSVEAVAADAGKDWARTSAWRLRRGILRQRTGLPGNDRALRRLRRVPCRMTAAVLVPSTCPTAGHAAKRRVSRRNAVRPGGRRETDTMDPRDSPGTRALRLPGRTRRCARARQYWRRWTVHRRHRARILPCSTRASSRA